MAYQNLTDETRVTGFDGSRRLASGALRDIVPILQAAAAGGGAVLIFADQTGQQVDLDLRGSIEDVLARLPSRRPGRPKLGVVAREVTLLARHWDFLSRQPGGASVTLRKLVEAAQRAAVDAPQAEQARETAYHFMTAIAGDFPGYEEAIRSLFAGDRDGFTSRIEAWPTDIRDHAAALAAPGLTAAEPLGQKA
jgi:hypothetical protein